MLRKLFKGVPSPSLVISCLALFIALGSVGYSATGGNFILGQPNTAADMTSLSSGVTSGASLSVQNTSVRPAARFISPGGVPSIAVSNLTKIQNLNADLLDGTDSSAFVRPGSPSAGGDVSGPFNNLQLNPGAVGSAEIADGSIRNVDVPIRLVQGASVTVPNNQNGTDFASCNADEVGIGGAIRWDVPTTGTVVLLSGPSVRADGTVGAWRVDGRNTSGATRTLVAFVYCLKS